MQYTSASKLTLYSTIIHVTPLSETFVVVLVHIFMTTASTQVLNIFKNAGGISFGELWFYFIATFKSI